MVKVLLIRHGQASFGKENYDELSELGHLQSEVLGSYLASTHSNISRVYRGTLQRHKDTWLGICKSFEKQKLALPECEIHAEFDELDAEALTQRHLPKLVLKHPHLTKILMKAPSNPDAFKELFEFVVNTWVSGGIKRPKIGTWEDFTSNVISGVRKVVKNHQPGETIAIVTSGGPISAIRFHIDSLELTNEETVEPALDWNLANTSVSKIHWCTEEEKLSLEAYNQLHHIEEGELHTTL